MPTVSSLTATPAYGPGDALYAVTGAGNSRKLLTMRVATIAAMTAIAAPTNGMSVQVTDVNRGGLFVFDTSATAAGNGGTTFSADDATTGSWVRRYSGPMQGVWFGADSSGIVVSHTALNAAIAAAIAADATLQLSGEFLVSDTVDFRNVRLDASNATINGSHAGVIVILGGDSARASNPEQSLFRASRVGGDLTNPWIRVMGAKGQKLWIQECSYLQFYADSDAASTTSIAYSEIHIGLAWKLELTTNPSPVGSSIQWINENHFHLQRCGDIEISGTYVHNHNRFYGGTFELSGGSTIDIQSGSSNIFDHMRLEGTGHQITFGPICWANKIEFSWASAQFSSFTPPSLDPSLTITDNGEANIVVRKDAALQDRLPILNVNGRVCRVYSDVAGGGGNNFAGNYTSIPGVDLRRKGIETFHQTNFSKVFESQLIPVDNGDAIEFEADASVFRVWVSMYDSSRVQFTDATSGVETYLRGQNISWSSGIDSFATTTNQSRVLAAIRNPAVKFIKLTVLTGGSTTDVTFRRLAAWLISAKTRLGNLASDQQPYSVAAVAASPVVGFAQVGEKVSNTAGGWFTNTFALDTTSSASAAASQADITLTNAAGITAGDIVGIEHAAGEAQWRIVSSVAGSVVTLTANLTTLAPSGSRVVVNRWTAS